MKKKSRKKMKKTMIKPKIKYKIPKDSTVFSIDLSVLR